MSITSRIAFALAASALVSACAEKPQTVSARKHDSQAWTGASAGFTVPGWKPGDEASWDEQIRLRNRGQNEYTRVSP